MNTNDIKEITVCPFCGAENSVISTGENTFHCSNCECDFDSDDIEHEVLRKLVSHYCSVLKATEDNPINCVREDVCELHISGFDEVAQGLPENLKPQVLSIFQDCEAIVWITTDMMNDPVELDDLITESIEEIVAWLNENITL